MKRYYSVKEAAKLLGFSTNTIYAYLETGKLKARRIGKGRYKIFSQELAPFLQTSAPSEVQVLPVVEEAPASATLKQKESGMAESPLQTEVFTTLFAALFFLMISVYRLIFDFSLLYQSQALMLFFAGVLLSSRLFFGKYLSRLSSILIYLFSTIALVANIAADFKMGDYNLIPLFLGFFIILASRIAQLLLRRDTNYYSEFITFSAGVIFAVPVLLLFAPVPSAHFYFLQTVTSHSSSLFSLMWFVIFLPILALLSMRSARRIRLMSVFFFVAAAASFANSAALVYRNSYPEGLSGALFGIFSFFLGYLVIRQKPFLSSAQKPMLLAITRVALTFCVLIFAASLVYRNGLRREASTNLAYVEDVVNQIDDEISQISQTTLSLAQKEGTAAHLAAGDIAAAKEDAQLLFSNSKNLESVVVLDANGKFVASAPDMVEVSVGEDLSQREYFQVTKNAKRGQVGDLFIGASKRALVVVSQPLFVNNTFVGLIAASPSLSSLSVNINQATKGPLVYGFDRSGTYLLHPRIESVGEEAPQAIIAQSEEVPFTIHDGYLRTFSRSLQTGWTFYTEYPLSSLSQNMQVLYILILLFAFSNAVISFVFMSLAIKGKYTQ